MNNSCKDLGRFLLLFAYYYWKKSSFKNEFCFQWIMLTVEQSPQINLNVVKILLNNTFIGIQGLQIYIDYIMKLIFSVRHRTPRASTKPFYSICVITIGIFCASGLLMHGGGTMSEKWKTVKMGGVNTHCIQGSCKNALLNRQAHMICQICYCFIC